MIVNGCLGSQLSIPVITMASILRGDNPAASGSTVYRTAVLLCAELVEPVQWLAEGWAHFGASAPTKIWISFVCDK